jgi:hypothetical protein
MVILRRAFSSLIGVPNSAISKESDDLNYCEYILEGIYGELNSSLKGLKMKF